MIHANPIAMADAALPTPGGSRRDNPSPGSRAPRWRRLVEIEDRIFTERRIRFYGLGVAVAYALSLAWRLVHGNGSSFPMAGCDASTLAGCG